MNKTFGTFLLLTSLFFQQCSNDNWQQIEIENLTYIKSANEDFVDKFKLPKIQDVAGKFKYISRDKISSFGYIFEISIDSMDLSQFDKAKLNEKDTVMIGNKKKLWGQTKALDYQFEIEFHFCDKDNFVIHTAKDSCDAETGKKNIIQKEIKNIAPQILKDTKNVKVKLYLNDYIEIVS